MTGEVLDALAVSAQLVPAKDEIGGWNDYDWSKPSLAVIASDGNGYGCVIFTVGAHVEFELKEGGLRDLGDLGLDDAPRGISIWEGKTESHRDYEGDVDTWLKGTFREPTEQEWASISRGGCPWDWRAWFKPAALVAVDSVEF